MSADVSGLRRALGDWATRVVETGANDAAATANRDPRLADRATGPDAQPYGGRPRDTVTVRRVTGGGPGARADLYVDTWGWQWRTGEPFRPFDPHQVLDGIRFVSPDDARLRNAASWPSTLRFHPGDHKGCLCATFAERARADRRYWRPNLTSAMRAGLIAAAGAIPL